MAETFPSGYNLERSSGFTWDSGVEADILEGGGYALRDLRGQYVTIDAKFNLLTQGEADTLQDFMLDNAGELILWTIDSTVYIGSLVSTVERTMTGPRFNIAFRFYAAVWA